MLQSALLALQPVDLNAGEAAELARRRKMAPTIDGGKPMALAIGARVIERLAPFLGRLAKESPGHWAKLAEQLKSKGAVVAEGAKGIVDYARQNPMNAALVFTTLASIGVSVGDLFSSEDKADPAVRATAVSLDQLMLGVNSRADALIANAAAASQNFASGVADREVELRATAKLCNWAKGHFGSVQAAIEGHQKLQGFVELSLADVEAGFRLLK